MCRGRLFRGPHSTRGPGRYPCLHGNGVPPTPTNTPALTLAPVPRGGGTGKTPNLDVTTPGTPRMHSPDSSSPSHCPPHAGGLWVPRRPPMACQVCPDAWVPRSSSGTCIVSAHLPRLSTMGRVAAVLLLWGRASSSSRAAPRQPPPPLAQLQTRSPCATGAPGDRDTAVHVLA